VWFRLCLPSHQLHRSAVWDQLQSIPKFAASDLPVLAI
jgi:hypothetical protein